MNVIFDRSEELLKKYYNIWNKVINNSEKEFDSKPFYNEKCLKTKTNCYTDEATGFHYKKRIPRVGSNYTCLAVILVILFLKKMKIHQK